MYFFNNIKIFFHFTDMCIFLYNFIFSYSKTFSTAGRVKYESVIFDGGKLSQHSYEKKLCKIYYFLPLHYLSLSLSLSFWSFLTVSKFPKVI